MLGGRKIEAFRAYLISVGDALSQLVGRILTWTDNPNESISGAAWRQRCRFPRVRKTIDLLLGEDHCLDSYTNDLRRAYELIKNTDEDF